MSSAEQREAFEGALRDVLNDSCSMDVVQAVHEQLSAKIAEHKESKIPEPLTMTPKDVGAILRDCRVLEEQIADFQTECEKQFGVDISFIASMISVVLLNFWLSTYAFIISFGVFSINNTSYQSSCFFSPILD